jgi:hypothetical protein
MRMTKNWTSKSDSKGNHHVLRKGPDTWESDDKATIPHVAKIFVLAVDNSELKYTMIPTLFPSFLHYLL